MQRNRPSRMLCIGDSLTQFSTAVAEQDHGPGWLTLLQARMGNRMHCLNFGVSGYNTNQGKHVLNCALRSYPSSDVVLLFYGANDAATGEQHVPLHQYVTNLREMIHSVQSDSAKPVLLTPPALCDEMRARHVDGTPLRTAATTAMYASACADLALELNVPCVQIHDEMINQKDVASFLHDGLHFNAKGNKLVEKLLVKCLDSELPIAAPGSLDSYFPAWDNLNMS